MGPQAHGLPRAEIAGRLLRLHGCSFEPWRSGERTRAAAEGCRPGNEISYRASGRRIEAARQAETASRAQSRATSAEDRSGSSSHAWNRAASCSADGIAEKPTQDISQGEIEWQKKTHSNRMDRPEAEGAPVLHGPAKRGKRNFVRKKKVCRFCVDKADFIDYKKAEILAPFIQERGKILPRRMPGTWARHQRWLTVAIKRAQNIALLPFAAEL